MRDGIAVARRGTPALALVTSKFWPQGEFVARAEGMCGVPRYELPHPVAGTGRAAMQALAREMVDTIFARLEGG